MATVEIEGQAPLKYAQLTPEKTLHILEQHVKGGSVVAEYAQSVREISIIGKITLAPPATALADYPNRLKLSEIF